MTSIEDVFYPHFDMKFSERTDSFSALSSVILKEHYVLFGEEIQTQNLCNQQ